MKKLIASLLIISFNAYSYPVGVQSQNGTAQYPALVKTPYSQVSKLPDGNSIIDTGNENMLVDAGMESVGISAWTCTTGTCTKSGTNGDYSSGKQALKVALSAQALNVSQSVATSTGIQTQGIVGVLYKVPSAITDFQVCSLIAGAEQTCVPTANLIKDNLYHSIEIPVTMTAGSTVGIKFKTTATYTQNVFLDAAYIKQGLGTQNLMLDNVYSAQVTTTSGTIANQSKTFLASCTAANPTVCTFTAGIFTATPNCWTTNYSSGPYVANIGTINSSSISITTMSGGGVNTGSVAFSLSCQKSGNDYLASSANVYSQASANYSYTNGGVITIGATTTGPTKGAVAIDRIMYQRNGQNLKALYQFTQSASGSSGSGEYLYTLPNGLSFDTNIVTPYSGTIGAAGTNAIQKAIVGWGHSANNVSDRGVCTLVAYDSTRFKAVCNTYNTGISYNTLGSTFYPMSDAGHSVYFNVDAPISGWSNSNVIIGSFEKIEKCANDYECTDAFSAKVSSLGVVSDENLDWISTCTWASAGYGYCNFNAGVFTIAPNCTATINIEDSTTYAGNTVSSITKDYLYFRTQASPSGSVSRPLIISCQKSGVDYKPKTAKIASSIGVPTVPGLTTQAVDAFSVSYGTTNATTICTASPCSYLDQIGSAVSSITRSGVGAYTLNTVKTYAKLKCVAMVSNAAQYIAVDGSPGSCSNCSSILFGSGFVTTAADSYGVVQCQGSY